MGDDFTAQLLKGFERRADAAKKQVEQRARRAAEHRQRLKKEQEQAEKERLGAEVDQMMARANQRVSAKRKKRKKRPLAAKTAASASSSAAAKPPAKPRTPVPRHKVNEMRTNYRAPPKRAAPGKVPKLGPNMEFVVRREKKKKQIRVPHTYDYSDMFGDDYWRGIDIDGAKKISKETAEATKEAQEIIAEREAQREKNKRDREENIREVRELERKGLWDEKTQNKRRLEQSEKAWVAVDTPVPIFRQKNSAVSRAAQSSSSASRLPTKSFGRPGSSSSALPTKKESAAQIQERARLFKERLMGLTSSNTKKSSTPKTPKGKSSSGSDSDANRRPSLNSKKRTPLKRRILDSEDSESEDDRRGKKRRRRASEDSDSDRAYRSAKRMRRTRVYSDESDSDHGRKSGSSKRKRRARDDSDDSDYEDRRRSWKKGRRARDDSDDSEDDRRRSRRSRKSSGSGKKPRSGRQGYISDEWSNSDGVEDSDEEDLFDISALDREEARSERLAKLEDKRELAKLRQDRKDKARRRQEFEERHGG